MTLDRRRRVVLIEDRLEGSGEHDVVVSFPLGPGRARASGSRLVLEGPSGAVTLRALEQGATWSLEPAALSPRYGAVVHAVTARRRLRLRVPACLMTEICLEETP